MSTVRSALYIKRGGGGKVAIDDMEKSTGARWFVDSTQSDASDSSTYGMTPDKPFSTLDYAIGKCTANAGDIIYLMPGHTESWTTTGAKVVADIAGVRIVGIGRGTLRPTFSFGHTGTTWTVSAANVSFENLLFVTAVDSVTTFATVSGTDCAFKNCEFRDAAGVEVITDLTVTGDRIHVIDCFKNGDLSTGDANVRVLSLNGVDGALVQGCRFMTKATTAVVGTVSNACTGLAVKDCVFYVAGTTNYTKTVVDGATGSSWAVTNCFDLGAGSNFSGGSGGALAGDDVGAVSTVATNTSTGVSAVNSKVDSVGIQTSAVASQAASVGIQTSTVASQAASVGIQTSTVNSKVDSVGLQASAVASQAASVGIQTSTVASQAASVGLQTSTVASQAASVGIQTSAVASQAASVGLQTSTVASQAASVGLQTSTVASQAASVGVQASTVESKADSVAAMLASIALIISVINSKT